MKTTLDIPDPIFRRAKARAARNGQSLKDFVAEAIAQKLDGPKGDREPSWKASFGALRDLQGETARIMQLVEADSEQLDEDE